MIGKSINYILLRVKFLFFAYLTLYCNIDGIVINNAAIDKYYFDISYKFSLTLRTSNIVSNDLLKNKQFTTSPITS